MEDIRIIETRRKQFLYNRTVEGEEAIFDDLIFRGGDGVTLAMRILSGSSCCCTMHGRLLCGGNRIIASGLVR